MRCSENRGSAASALSPHKAGLSRWPSWAAWRLVAVWCACLCLLLLAGPCPMAHADETPQAQNGSQSRAASAADKAAAAAALKEEQANLAETRAKAEDALKALEKNDAEEKQAQTEATEQKRQEVAEIAENDPLKDLWAGQRVLIDTVIQEATRLSSNFLDDTSVLDQIGPIEQEIRRQLVMVNDFKTWPSILEAVSRRMVLSADLVESLLLSAGTSMKSAQSLLEQLDRSAESMSEINLAHHGEMAEYLEKINTARFLLTALIARYTSALAPARALVDRVAAVRGEISTMLPALWKNYYTQPPVPWLTASEWSTLKQSFDYLGTGLSLRRSVELPLTSSQWQGALTRFFLTLLVTGCISLLLVNHFLSSEKARQDNIKKYSLPWNVLGFALLAAAYTPTLEPFRLFMALGNICLILGLVTFAWELRRLKFTDVEVEASPLLRLMPLTIGAYALLYIPIARVLTLAVWLVFVILAIWWTHRRPQLALGKMQLEHSILDMQTIVLWACLVICLTGFHFYSMALYLLYSSLAIALQVSVASLSYISRLNEALNNEDSRTMFASFLLALAAPFVLLFAAATVSLWLATLPGGMDLLQFYIFKSVSIGTTQLNLVQVLFIATAFFLARTAARMGKGFIGKLPARGFKIDTSLITPMQTGYVYFVWCLFGFFVLRSLGMNLSNLAVIAGGLSVGIGFGMQTIVNNFISGIILIFSRNLQVGDVVEVGGVVGRIKQINVRATMVETYDSAVIYVPNSAFVSGNLTNWTSNSRTARQQVLVGVAYGSDTQRVTKLLLDIANKNSGVLAFPQPSVQFLNFGASTLDFRLTFWVRDYDIGTGVASEIRYAIHDRFAREGIDIAYPQMDVHVKAELPAPKGLSTLPQTRSTLAVRSRRPGRVVARLPRQRA